MPAQDGAKARALLAWANELSDGVPLQPGEMDILLKEVAAAETERAVLLSIAARASAVYLVAVIGDAYERLALDRETERAGEVLNDELIGKPFHVLLFGIASATIIAFVTGQVKDVPSGILGVAMPALAAVFLVASRFRIRHKVLAIEREIGQFRGLSDMLRARL